MEINPATISDLYAKHKAVPCPTIFYLEMAGQPHCCLLGLLDLEMRGQPDMQAARTERISTYVTRVAAEYQLSQPFVVGLMYGWDWWDAPPSIMTQLRDTHDYGRQIDEAGFALGQAIGRRIFGEPA